MGDSAVKGKEAPPVSGRSLSIKMRETDLQLLEGDITDLSVDVLVNAANEKLQLGTGVTAAQTRWFLAEGATGSFFNMFILVANPSSDAADVQWVDVDGVEVDAIPQGHMLLEKNEDTPVLDLGYLPPFNVSSLATMGQTG